MTALAIACALSISAEAEWPFPGLEHCLAKRSCPRLIMTILVALVMAVGFVLPSFAQMPAQHEHSANATEMSPATMGHHHAMRTANSGPAKQSGACGKFCPVCAITCCGVILPVIATIPFAAVTRFRLDLFANRSIAEITTCPKLSFI